MQNDAQPLTWETTQSPAAADAERVTEGVFSHGRSLAKDGQAQPLACFARRDGVVVAGAVGRTEYRRLFVASLWVSEPLRHRGLGSETLLRLEAEAARRGCSSALLETLSDDTAGLYARLGYQTLAVIEEYVGPFHRHIMLKRLSGAETADAHALAPGRA